MKKKKKSTKFMLNKISIANLDLLENSYMVELPPHVLKNIYAALSEHNTEPITLYVKVCMTSDCTW